MTAAGTGGSWDAAWRRIGASLAAPSNPLVPTFAQAYREFGRWVQGVASVAPAAELHRHLADAAERTARQVGDLNSPQPYWSVVPTALMAALPSGPMAGPAAESFERMVRWADEFAALPVIGPYREWADTALGVQRAVLGERAAAARMSTHYRAISAEALTDFAHFLRADDGPPITTLRALYGAWVERAEAAYSAHVMTANFADDFAAWVNAGSALRAAGAGLAERVATSFDWPQRAEINALLKRQRALELEIAELRARAAVSSPVAVAAPARPAASDSAQEVSPPSVSQVAAPPPARVRAPRAARVRPASSPRAETVKATVPRPKRKPRSGAGEFDIAAILKDDP